MLRIHRSRVTNSKMFIPHLNYHLHQQYVFLCLHCSHICTWITVTPTSISAFESFNLTWASACVTFFATLLQSILVHCWERDPWSSSVFPVHHQPSSIHAHLQDMLQISFESIFPYVGLVICTFCVQCKCITCWRNVMMIQRLWPTRHIEPGWHQLLDVYITCKLLSHIPWWISGKQELHCQVE